MCVFLATGPSWLTAEGRAAETDSPRVLIVCGPSSHPPGTHEVAAGARLMKHCLENPTNRTPINTELRHEWPRDKNVLMNISAVVFIGDLFPPERLKNPEKIKADLADMMSKGCGMVCVHYATGLRPQHVGESGEHPLLGWLGGYFASHCPHHRSVAKVVTTTIVPADKDHPVLRGWKRFKFKDEPYWNNYFGKDGPRDNVTSLACALVPPDEPRKETVVWAVEREDSGRGVGIVMPHYYRNWALDDLRTMVLNSICWSAKCDVPPDGVKTELPDLKTFKPDAVSP
ncbi:MAG: ThuA domain-containing protein [Planctomycetota bacterium]